MTGAYLFERRESKLDSAPTPCMIEREIADKVRAAKLRLRFDKVALRLIRDLKNAVAEIVPENQTLVFTVTAPINRPSKTAAAIEDLVRDSLPDSEVHRTIYDNRVLLGPISGVAPGMPKVVGFVHNPESDARSVLALARARLLEQNEPS